MIYNIYKFVYENKVVYVGQTTKTLIERKKNRYRNNPELQKIYLDCEMILIEETEDKSRERYWIDFYKQMGFNLLNKHLPGRENIEIIREKDRIRRRKRYKINKEKEYEYNKIWIENNKEKNREYKRNYMRRIRGK